MSLLPSIIIKYLEGNKTVFKKSDYLILSAAALSFLFSVALWFGKFGPDQKDAGLFVGIWVPSILSFGIYFQIIFGRKSNGR